MTTEDVSVMSTETLSVMTTEEKLIYLNSTTITPVIFIVNCSVYNPCGRTGYCRDNSNDNSTCVCKFWWNGTLCNELTNSGKQVITLGVLLGVLLICFYGLALFRSIRKRQRSPKTDTKQNTSTIKRTFPTIPIHTLHPSRRLFSWITGVLTLILATCTLVAKWSILKPIHEEIIHKYNTNQPLFFKRHSFCQIIDLTAQFNLFTFPVACLLIILFSIITKRVSFQRDKYCGGYIGIPIPLDFFAHVKRTLAAVIFAIFADELLEIANGLWSGNSPSTDQGIIVTYLIQILKVFVIGFRRYPILAAVYIDNCFSLICATLYVWLDYSIAIVYTGHCLSDFYLTDQNFNKSESNRTYVNFDYYGTGSKILFLQLLTDIPRYLCLAYISIKLPMLLIKRLQQRKLTDRRLTREQKNLLYSSLPYSAESRYVKRLLGITSAETPTNRFTKITQRIYVWRDDFRFSSRVVCVYASVFLLLFFLTVKTCVVISPWLHQVREFFQEFIDMFSAMANSPDPELTEQEEERAVENQPSDFPIPNLVRPYLFAVFIALILTVIQLLVMLANIRRNLLQAFRGDPCELPRRTAARNLSYITGNFHFAGYLIGYVILAYIFLLFIVTVLTVAIDAFITYGSVKLLESLLRLIIPAILFICFKLFLNKILGRYAFLQHSGEVLSLNNRRAFMVFLYFNCFLDAFLGVVAALMRLVKSIIGGVIYMCRLDYSPLGRKLETMDAGFNAYCGFIYMECAHRHPVLLCFVSHLLRDHLYPSETKRLSKAKHKWHLAVFLINNPVLIYRRKGFLTYTQQNEMKIMLLGGNNPEQMYLQQPPVLTHRASIISEKVIDDLWERRRF